MSARRRIRRLVACGALVAAVQATQPTHGPFLHHHGDGGHAHVHEPGSLAGRHARDGHRHAAAPAFPSDHGGEPGFAGDAAEGHWHLSALASRVRATAADAPRALVVFGPAEPRVASPAPASRSRTVRARAPPAARPRPS